MSGERTTVEILRAARERIAGPERWTRGAYGRDKEGRITEPLEPEAVCWCAVGSVLREQNSEDETTQPLHVLCRAAEEQQRHAEVPDINDGPRRTLIEGNDDRPRYLPNRHRKVLAMYDRAIELAEAEA